MAVVNGVLVALAPPDGYVVDFDHPARNSVTQAYWLYGVGTFASLLFMLQRVYVKLVIRKSVQWDDAWLLMAWLFSTVLQAIIIRGFARGIMGTHGWEMPFTKFEEFAMDLYLLPILYTPVQLGTKMTLLFLYRQLGPQRWYKASVYTVMGIVVTTSVTLFFITIFPCKPVSGAWDLTIAATAKCMDRPKIFEATAIVGAVEDLMVLLVPIPLVINLQISRQQKTGLVVLFSLGLITVVTSIARLVALINSLGEVDQSWGGGIVLLWIFVEANMSIICGSMLTIKPFLSHVSPRIFGTSVSASTSGVSGANKLRTVNTRGARSQRENYSRFDYELETVIDIEGGDGGGARDRRHNAGWEDGNSEKAIVQTRSTTVTYD